MKTNEHNPPPETIPDRYRLKPLIIFIVVVLMWSPGLSDNILLLDSAWLVRDNAELASGQLSVVWDAFFSFDPAHRWASLRSRVPPDTGHLGVAGLFAVERQLADASPGQHPPLCRWLCLVDAVAASNGSGHLPCGAGFTGLRYDSAHLANVLWLAGRKDVLGLCAVLLMMRYGMRASGKAIAATAALLLVAIWSKNTSYSGLAWLFAAGAIFAPEKWRGRWVPRGLLWWANLCCIGISTIVGKGSGIIANAHVDHLWQLPVFQGQLLLRYLWVLLDPSALSLVHTTPSVYNIGWTEAILAIVGWATLIIGPFVLLRRNKLAGFGLLCWGVGFVPVSQLIPLQNTLADRYLLLPTVGLAIMFAALPRSRVWDIVILVLIGYWSFYTWHRMPLWSSEILLLEDALEKVPDDEKSQHILTHSRIKASPENGQRIAEDALKTYGSVAGLHHLLATQHADPAESLRQHHLAVSQAQSPQLFAMITPLPCSATGSCRTRWSKPKPSLKSIRITAKAGPHSAQSRLI